MFIVHENMKINEVKESKLKSELRQKTSFVVMFTSSFLTNSRYSHLLMLHLGSYIPTCHRVYPACGDLHNQWLECVCSKYFKTILKIYKQKVLV